MMPSLVTVIGFSGVYGASMIFALFSDTITFLTMHMYWFYIVATRIYNWQFTVLYSLFNLFFGKCCKQFYLVYGDIES